MSVLDRPAGSAIEIGPREFQVVRDVVYRETGIKLADSKRALVEARLGKRLRFLGMSSYRDYVQLLSSDRGSSELLELINSITTNKTSFFREEHHFDFLRDQLFPAAAGREVRIWSAGCSLGSEPYSIAITAAEANARVRILATDIDTNVLATAKSGVYDIEQLSGVSPDALRKYFLRGDGDKRGFFRVKPALRDMIEFQRLNLIAPQWSVREQFDVIFCRNVIIYFDRATQRTLFERFAERLAPGGLLILGHSENLAWMPEVWEACGRTMYRRRGDAGTPLRLAGAHFDPPAIPLGAPPPVAPAAPARKIVRIEAGGVHASRGQIEVRTVLGSCVSACLYDPEMQVGGMNHFMLPNGEFGDTSARYGVHAMELLINQIMKLGGDRRRLRAKVFGASRVLKGLNAGIDVGRKNAEFAREFLSNESIIIEAEQLGGTSPLEVRMETDSGRVRVRSLESVSLDSVVRREERTARRITPPVLPTLDVDSVLF